MRTGERRELDEIRLVKKHSDGGKERGGLVRWRKGEKRKSGEPLRTGPRTCISAVPSAKQTKK